MAKGNLEKSDYVKLTDYIQELYLAHGWQKENIPWTMLMSQIKNQVVELNAKYTGLKYTLWYMVEIKEVDLFDYGNGSILNLLPFYYRDAMVYWKEMAGIKKAIEEFDFEEEVKVIKGNSKKKSKINLDF